MKIASMILAACLTVGLTVSVVHAASAERAAQKRDPCQVEADFAAEVFDLINENPRVILSGNSADDVNSFAFIRQWIREGKSRTELLARVWNACPDGI
jgi:hypothetical protein